MMNWAQPKVYAVVHKNENTRIESRSGGIFTALSDQVLKDGGIVYGCVLAEDFSAMHVRADSVEMRNKMRGSKYIQSALGDTFSQVKMDLEMGRKVLFSGTSCQVAGLKKYLRKEYEHLICVDIVCHGVSSNLVWQEYLKWQSQKCGQEIISADFRNKKKYGWHAHIETLTLDNKKTISSRVFKFLYLGNNMLRPSCYECPYKTIMHPGEITIADYWGIEKAAPEYDDNKGVSLVLVNSEAGEKLFAMVKNEVIWKETRIEDSMQPALKHPTPMPTERKQFWADFQRKSFGYLAKRYGGYGVSGMFRKVMQELQRRTKKR